MFLGNAKLHLAVTCFAILMLALAVFPGTARSQGGYIVVNLQGKLDVQLGSQVSVPLVLVADPVFQFGHFRLLIMYDTRGVTFLNASAGQLLTDCGWEYFACTDTLIPGIGTALIIEAIADIDNGPENHPSCLLPGGPGTLAELHFVATNDLVYSCYSFPVAFLWNSCEDNVFYTANEDSVLISHMVYDWFEHMPVTPDDTFPTFNGAPDSCSSQAFPGLVVMRGVDLTSDMIDLHCQDSIDLNGDINLNGIANEIADYIILANYFLHGFSAFTINLEGQIAASDVNCDGSPISIRDLLYLFRIIIGDALPPRLPAMETDTAVFVQNLNQKSVTLEYSGTLGAAHLIFQGAIAVNETSVGTCHSDSSSQGDSTCILINPDFGQGVNSYFGQGPVLTYWGTGKLIHVEVADYQDQNIPVRIEREPPFLCGDADANTAVDVSDAVRIINYVFVSGIPPSPIQSADVNCDLLVDVTDAFWIINYVFIGSNQPCDTNGDQIPDC